MSKGSKQKHFRPYARATKVSALGKELDFRNTTGSWRRDVQPAPGLGETVLGRLVLGSEDVVEAIQKASDQARTITSGGLLVMSYIRGAGYNKIQHWDVERVFRRLITLDTATQEACADVKKIVKLPVLNKYGKTSAVLVKSQLVAPDLIPEVSRFNGIRAEIPGSPNELDLSIRLTRADNLAHLGAILSAVNDTLPESITLGPLAVLQTDASR